MNQKILFNTGWSFAKSGLEAVDCNGLNFEPVDLPHDWLIYNTLNLYENSIGWYRKEFTYKMDEKLVLLYFEGVYMDSTLYVNGKYVGEWKYGYSSFEHDITDALKDGENEILLKVVYQHPNSRWYTGAGIYRNVWLKVRDKTHFVTDGIYVSTQQKEKCWQVDIDTELDISRNVRVSHQLLYKGEEVAASETNVEAAGSVVCSQQSMVIDDPLLWSPENPNLYQLVSKLYIDNPSQNNELIETVSQNIGFRNIEFNPEFGLKLNGKKYKLNGVCDHHNLGALGSAFNIAALKRRFELLKEMGVNAIRTAHNMPAPELMNLADEMGFLIDTESFDTWELSKNEYDYSRFFKDWYHKDLKSWVKRDRNHPSLLMWSIGNEIYDTHAGERGQAITKILMGSVKQYDPRQNGRVTFASNYMPWENTQKCADIIKMPGYNYAEKYYQKHHNEHPDWIIYGSETSSTVQSRGIYHFPIEKSILSDDDEQCSSLGNSATSWGAKSTEACIIADRDSPFSCGQFIWCGFDYIGEPTPYHTQNCYFGQLDTATFPKDSYYIYQAEWTDYRNKPMIHIFPYWDFSKGQLVDVRV
jgi:beta-galactosidase